MRQAFGWGKFEARSHLSPSSTLMFPISVDGSKLQPSPRCSTAANLTDSPKPLCIHPPRSAFTCDRKNFLSICATTSQPQAKINITPPTTRKTHSGSSRHQTQYRNIVRSTGYHPGLSLTSPHSQPKSKT
jgi:hypothetical protein